MQQPLPVGPYCLTPGACTLPNLQAVQVAPVMVGMWVPSGSMFEFYTGAPLQAQSKEYCPVGCAYGLHVGPHNQLPC